MPIINEEQLKREISSKNLAPVYLLFGDDSFLKSHYTALIEKNTDIGDPFFNLQKFEAEVDLQSVYDAVNQFPMMADKKVVILSDYDFEKAAKTDFDKLCSLLEDTPDSCVLVLKFDTVEVDAKRSSKAKKLIAAAEKGKGRAVELGRRSRAELIKMLISGAKKRGCHMENRVADYIIEAVGDDINTLRHELDKLCAFRENTEIEKAAVDLVCTKSVEASVYDYVKEIFDCNISGALSLLDNMFYMHFEPMIILHTASTAYVDMYRVLAAGKAGVNRAQVAQDFGYKNRAFVLDRAARNLQKLDRKKLKLSFDALLAADKALKSYGADPRAILEQLTVKLVYIIVKGESVD